MSAGAPLLAWVLWSPRRAACAAAAVLAAAVGAAGAAPRPAAPAPRPAPARAPARPPAPASAAPPAVPAAAVAAGQHFAAAWTDHGPGWLVRTARYATPELAAQLALAQPALPLMPATAVAGPPRAAGRTDQDDTLSVPTNAGPAMVTVTRVGGRWLAAAVALAAEGS